MRREFFAVNISTRVQFRPRCRFVPVILARLMNAVQNSLPEEIRTSRINWKNYVAKLFSSYCKMLFRFQKIYQKESFLTTPHIEIPLNVTLNHLKIAILPIANMVLCNLCNNSVLSANVDKHCRHCKIHLGMAHVAMQVF